MPTQVRRDSREIQELQGTRVRGLALTPDRAQVDAGYADLVGDAAVCRGAVCAAAG